MTPHCNQIRQRQGQKGKDKLRIDKDNWRRSGALRESPKTDANNMIPERMSEPPPISMEPDHKWSLTDLPECSPSIDNKNNQGEDPDSKGNIPVDKGTVYFNKSTPFDTSLYTFLSP
jgi:hypothetical protein